MNPLLRLALGGKVPISLTYVDEAHGAGSASLGAGQTGDLIIGLNLSGGNISGGAFLSDLVPGYGGYLSYIISGAGASISGTYDCYLIRFRPSKAITSVSANSTLTDVNVSSGSVPGFGSSGVNLVVGFGQESTPTAFMSFTSLTNVYGSRIKPQYASAQVAINPAPASAAAFTVTGGGAMYGNAYANAVQINIQG